MELVLSLLALCVSLIALWLGSTSLKRIDSDLNAFLLNARKELSATKATIVEQVASISDRANSIENLIRTVRLETSTSKTAMENLEKEIAGLRKDLDVLDESIPKQFRHRTTHTPPSQTRQ